MAETQIRFGILGCANVARKVSRAITLAPNAALYAIGSRSLEKAKAFASANGFPPSAKIYGSYEAVLDDPDVDAVYLPLPTTLHVHWAVLAAQKKKHVLLEKPVALNVKELEIILHACKSNEVQFMDATMWMHHPRSAKMKEFLSDSERFGVLKSVQSCLSFPGPPEFLENDIRMKPDLDALGALGDLGWYTIRAILWAANFELPKSVVALRDPLFNKAGLILSCGASFHWEDGKIASFQCSFLENLTANMTAIGTKGTLYLRDYVVPFEEEEASFSSATCSCANDLVTAWLGKPIEETVLTDLPQEALMVKEFSRLVASIKNGGSKPDEKWPTLSKKTQLVVDAVKISIDRGFEPVHSIFRFAGPPGFWEKDIRTKPDLDGLGSLGDLGWYTIRAILWATDFKLSNSVVALPDPVVNKAGVILSCNASLHWEDGRVGTFRCSYVDNLTMNLIARETKGTLFLNDIAVPFRDDKACFSTSSRSWLSEIGTEWVTEPIKRTVVMDVPQEDTTCCGCC